MSAFLVEGERAGLRRGPRTPLLGLRGLGTGELHFRDCWIPSENLIGAEGEGFKRAMRMLDVGRIGVASMAMGISAAALDAACSYANARIQFGQPIAGFQAIQFLLADMDTKLAAARLLTYRAAALRDLGVPFSLEAARAKLFASDVAMELASDALQVHGGHGYVADAPVQRYFRDAKATQIIEGTNQIQRLVIARRLLGER